MFMQLPPSPVTPQEGSAAALLAAFRWRGAHTSVKFVGQDITAADCSLTQASNSARGSSKELLSAAF